MSSVVRCHQRWCQYLPIRRWRRRRRKPSWVRNDRVKKSATVQLWWQFDLAMFNNDETIEDYTLVVTLATQGKVVGMFKIVEKIVRGVLVRFK